MSPRHAILFTIVFAILVPYYYLVDTPALKLVRLREQQESLLKLSTIDSLTLTRGAETIRFQKTSDPKRYQVVEPANGFIPQDLMQATMSLLMGAKSVEVVSDNPNDLRQFGLDQPTTTMVITAPGRQPIRIEFGSLNPTKTAVYARIIGIPKVFLMGRNLDYYQTLMFQWIEGKQGKNA
jgi:Domain of unknown function (DUF4340)